MSSDLGIGTVWWRSGSTAARPTRLRQPRCGTSGSEFCGPLRTANGKAVRGYTELQRDRVADSPLLPPSNRPEAFRIVDGFSSYAKNGFGACMSAALEVPDFFRYALLLLGRQLRENRKRDDLCRNATRHGKIGWTVMQPGICLLHVQRNGIMNPCSDTGTFQMLHQPIAIF